MNIKSIIISQAIFISFLSHAQGGYNFEVDLQKKQKLIENIQEQQSKIKNQKDSIHNENFHPKNDSVEDQFKVHLRRLIIDTGGESIALNDNDFVRNYLGKEIGRHDIFSIIRELNIFLAKNGYITSVVTLVPGNISSGVLTLKVNWGRISKITVNNKDPKSATDKILAYQLLPNARGRVLNVRDLDQIVENGSNYKKTIKVNIIPDVEKDYSILNVLTVEQDNNNYNVSFDNSGPGNSRKSGLYRYSLSASYSDIILGSDTLSLLANTRHITRDEGNSNYYLSGNYSFPIGNTIFSFGVNDSKSKQLVGGDLSSYDSKANQFIYTGSIEHVLYRAKEDKLSASLQINRRKAKNYFNSELIDVSSKAYSDVNVGLQYVSVLNGTSFYADLTYNQGLPWFDGQKAGYKDNHLVEVNRWLSNFSIGRRFSAFEHDFNFNTRASLQYSKYNMIDIYRMSVGDEYTVRGFRDGALGDSGVSLTNTLQMPLSFSAIQLSPFIGYDVGYTRKNNDGGTSALSGAAIGIKSNWHDVNSAMTLGVPLFYDKEIKDVDPYTVYFNVGYSF